MLNDFSITFDNHSCSIYDKESGKKYFDVRMISNRMFPLVVCHSSALLANEIFNEKFVTFKIWAFQRQKIIIIWKQGDGCWVA